MSTESGIIDHDAGVPTAVKCYFDGSYGDDDLGDRWITLAGVAATDHTWTDFETKWSRMLIERYPVAPYVHMTELLGSDDPFERSVGWTREKKVKLIEDAIVVLSQVNKDEFMWFRCSINKTAVNRLFEQGEKVVADPYSYCSLNLAQMVIPPYLSNCRRLGRQPEKILLYYDRNEGFMDGLSKAWLSNRTPLRRPRDPNNLWDSIEDIFSADQAFTPPLQVADMVAWAYTHTLPTDAPREFSRLKGLLIQFAPSRTLDLTEDAMRHFSQIINAES